MSYRHNYPMTGAPYQPYPYAPPRATNQNAIMALVFGFVFWPIAFYFAKKAKDEIAYTGEDGEGMATAGLVLFWIHLILFVLSLLFLVVYFVFIFLLIGAATTGAGVS